MNTEQKKALVKEYILASGAHDAKRLGEMMTDDATYWVQGKPHLFPAAGEKTRAQILAYMSTPSIFKDGLKATFGACTAEGDNVALEVESLGVAPNGKTYNNTYHYLFVFRGDKIARVKEYVDTYHAAEVFTNTKV
jgi:ketosteroid isomerase-like protein